MSTVVQDKLKARANVAEEWNKLQRREKVDISPGVGWKEKREWENQRALGGLRNPCQAVVRTPGMWRVETRLKTALLKAMTRWPTQLPPQKGGLEEGLSPVLVQAAVEELAAEFGSAPDEKAEPYRHKLLAAILEAAGDLEKDVPV